MLSADAKRSLETQITQHQAELHGADGAGALSYLIGRGLTHQTIQCFRLGYDPGRHRIVIPYLNPEGAWGLKYRCLHDHDCKEAGHGKYTYDGGQELHLYNASALLAASHVVVVEGEFKAMATGQAGDPAVGYPGTQAWDKADNEHWPYCFDSVESVVVVADGDEPGRKAAARVAKLLRGAPIDADVRVVDMPDGLDPDSFILEYGVILYRERLGFI